MQCLNNLIRTGFILGALSLPLDSYGQTLLIEENYCHATALLAHATAEARQRSTPELQWQNGLKKLAGVGVQDKTNVLYTVLPRAIVEVRVIYKNRKLPKEAYKDSFNQCMGEDYGKMVVIK